MISRVIDLDDSDSARPIAAASSLVKAEALSRRASDERDAALAAAGPFPTWRAAFAGEVAALNTRCEQWQAQVKATLTINSSWQLEEINVLSNVTYDVVEVPFTA